MVQGIPMKYKSLSFLAAMILGVSFAAHSLPAKRGLHTLTQPDGTTIEVRIVGDEFSHYYLTPDGYPLLADSDGVMRYVTLAPNGVAVMSDVKACDVSRRGAAETEFVGRIDRQAVTKAIGRRTGPRKIPESGKGLFSTGFPSKGDIRSLVILVEYSDVKFTLSDPLSYFTDMLNKKGFSEYKGTGSARDYFLEQSDNQFRPTFDVVGPVKLPKNRAYYGGNNYNGDDLRPEQMIVDAAALVAGQVDFSRYDLDNDGYVDNIYVFYAGGGEASGGGANTVWPHSFNLTYAGYNVRYNGVILDRYACSNEWENGRPDGIGTFVHEFSHVMGLPDLYCTDYSESATLTPGAWSVLDSGPYNNDGRTPPSYSIYERNAMGWLKPVVIDGPMSAVLEPIDKSNAGYIVQTGNPNEFFLIENRQQQGWDKYIPGHGMLVWHIDFNQNIWNQNIVNNNPKHLYVDIEEAGGTANNKSQTIMAAYPFPGTRNVTSFTDDTKPSMKTWAGKSLGVPIANIMESDGVISFDACGGAPRIATPVFNPAVVGDDGFTLSWNPVEDAAEYFVTVKSIITEGNPMTMTYAFDELNDDAMPSGWTTDGDVASYVSNGNFGLATPAFKLSPAAGSSQTLTTPYYESEISALGFWYKGVLTDTSSKLTIEGRGSADGDWQTVREISTLSRSGVNIDVDAADLAGIHQLRFVYDKTKGNLSLDDVVISVGSTSTVVMPGYDNVSTGLSTQIEVAPLVAGVTDYICTIYAVNANGDRSLTSKALEVVVNGSNGIYDAVVAAPAISVVGRDVIVSVADAVAVDLTGRTVATAVDGRMTMPSAGVYIIIANGHVSKIAVK